MSSFFVVLSECNDIAIDFFHLALVTIFASSEFATLERRIYARGGAEKILGLSEGTEQGSNSHTLKKMELNTHFQDVSVQSLTL